MWELDSLGPESDSGPGAAQVRSVQLAVGVPTKDKAGGEDSGRWFLELAIGKLQQQWGIGEFSEEG